MPLYMCVHVNMLQKKDFGREKTIMNSYKLDLTVGTAI